MQIHDQFENMLLVTKIEMETKTLLGCIVGHSFLHCKTKIIEMSNVNTFF